MKSCPWCGKEYSDDLERCPADAELLLSSGAEPLNLAAVMVAPTPSVAQPQTDAPAKTLLPWQPAERQLRVFEIVLLCWVAFGGSILYSLQHYPGLLSPSPTGAARNWLYSSLHEFSALGLLWYILLRRSTSLSDLGFSWVNKDVVRSLLVWLAGSAAFSAIYGAVYACGLTSTSHSTASARVARLLFSGGVTPVTIAFQFINPFFEELIVRAFLITAIRQLTGSVSKGILLSVLVQTSYHLYQGAPMALGLGGTFLIFSLYYAKTNRITPVILAHLYMDVFATMAYMLVHR